MKEKNASPFPPLNLPAAALHLRNHQGTPVNVADIVAAGEDCGPIDVFDPLRRRYVRLTPEEWVRQHFTAFLITHKGYPSGLLGNEVSLEMNGLSRRCDTVLYGLNRMPKMIVEYKAPTVALTQKVFDQVWRYNTVLRVEWLVVSNGLQHVVCHLDTKKGTYGFLPEVPSYVELASL